MNLLKKISVLCTILYITSSCITLENEDVTLNRSEVDYNVAYNQEENLEVKKTMTHKGQRFLFLYSFEQEREVDIKHLFTDMWDIAFKLDQHEHGSQEINYFYNHEVFKPTDIFIGIGNELANPIGFKGNVTGYIAGKDFHEVAVAQDSKNALDNAGNYYVNSTIERPNGYIAKLINLLPNRTFVIKTTKGNYVKMELQAVHKDQPKKITLDSKYFYLTFRYFIQRDGTRNLITK